MVRIGQARINKWGQDIKHGGQGKRKLIGSIINDSVLLIFFCCVKHASTTSKEQNTRRTTGQGMVYVILTEVGWIMQPNVATNVKGSIFQVVGTRR